ncbi:beta-1,6-N-acetylglucosaminyltransferase [Carnobacterium jeotgali]|uniref:beta-1,6-N-acetylglucosaminyltransferase n=1 Tax=Carnobacterium jeotgali TaxID=545534 RepID=UPI000493A3A3|nr:beta-1,6-N-acetylglucosaminyltransferase [Carnobacterium jeotgali]
MNLDKICYLILAYNDPENLHRLVNRLNDRADFYIHIDKKNDITPFATLFDSYPNVTLIQNRVKIYWGGFSIVQAELNLIETALNKHDSYMRYVLLSGSDYPIKNSNDIYRFFEKNTNTEFIRGINLDKIKNKELFGLHIDLWQKHDYPWIKKTNTTFFKIFRAVINKVLRKFHLPKAIRHHKFDLYHGSQWWALTDSCLRELINIYHSKERDYLIFKIGFASDEKFFHTLFFNSSFANKNQVNGPDQAIDIKDRAETTFQTSLLANIHIIDKSMTKWFSYEDFDEIMKSDKLFVRKVSTDKSKKLLEAIDQHILENEVNMNE